MNKCMYTLYTYINKRIYTHTHICICVCRCTCIIHCRCNQHYYPCTLILLVYIHVNECTLLSFIYVYTYICVCVYVCMCDTEGALTTTGPVQTLVYIFKNECMYAYSERLCVCMHRKERTPRILVPVYTYYVNMYEIEMCVYTYVYICE